MPSRRANGRPPVCPPAAAPAAWRRMVQIIKALGRGESVDFAGRHFNLDSVTVKPWPVQPDGVPIYLACHWGARAREAQIKRAARLADGVISISDSPEEHTLVIEAVREEAAALGRDPDSLETVMYLTVNMDTDLARGRSRIGAVPAGILRRRDLGRPLGSLRRAGAGQRTHRPIPGSRRRHRHR